MLGRLKTLPLTIFLTVLIWMYAEAQFTATREDVRISVRILSPSSDISLRALDSHGAPVGAVASVAVTLQGPKSQIDRIFQESQGQLAADDDLATLTYTPPPADLKPGQANGNSIDTVSMLNSLAYFRRHSVVVTAASPPSLRLEVDTFERLARTPEFHPSVTLDRLSINPEQVTVSVPSRLLRDIGGWDKVTVSAVPLRDLGTLPPDSDHTVPVRFAVDYPGTRDERVSVAPLQGSVTVHIPRTIGLTETIPDIPVWVSGPPTIVARYEVELRPKVVRATVSGSAATIQALRQRLATSGGIAGVPAASGIHVYLDIKPDDTPTTGMITRRLRYALPEGLTLQEAPVEIEFRLLDRAASAPPTTQPTTNK